MAPPKAPHPRRISVKSSLCARYQLRGKSAHCQESVTVAFAGILRGHHFTIEVPTVTDLRAYKLPPEYWDLGKPICNSNHHV